jgi:hypothetical protein
MSSPIDAPGCFASASVFSHDSSVCQRCSAFDACTGASLQTLEMIKGIVNIDDFLKRHQRARKVAQVVMKDFDEMEAETLPPGNIPKPDPVRKVERKTKVVKVMFELSKDEEFIIAKLQVKPKAQAILLCTSGKMIEVRKALSERRNPFTVSDPDYLRITIDRLLAGGFSKKSLCESFVGEIGHKYDTARSHMGIVCALLVGFGFAKEHEGKFVLTPVSVV